MRRFASRLSGALLALVTLVPVAGCGLFGDESAPEDVARQFLATFVAGDTGAASRYTDAAESAKATLDELREALQPEAVAAEVTKVDHTEGATTATARFTMTWDLGRNRQWTYPGEMELAEDGESWKVRWSTTVVHPKLAAQQSIAVQDTEPVMAPVLARDGEAVLQPGRVVSILLDPTTAGDLRKVAEALSDALVRFDETITAQSIIEGAKKEPDQAYLVAVLRDADYQAVKPTIYPLPGVHFTAAKRLLAVDKEFATQLIPGIRDLVEEQVAGKAGWRVITTDAAGNEVAELHAEAAEPAHAVTTTISKRIQDAAQATVDRERTASMIVAMQPSTGELLAVAQNAKADAVGPVALLGRYPPGSTFKTVTVSAALASGMVEPDTEVGCPGTITIEGRLIPNAGKFDKGTLPLHSAYAYSCNTTFARLASQMAPDQLTNTAKQLGIGVDFVVPGITTVTGSVPPATDIVERAEDGFGQGKVVASPFGMALAASTVASGTMPIPSLVRDTVTEVDAEPEGLPAEVTDAVADMMHEMQQLTPTLADFPELHGKTGTAQFGDGSRAHGWFIGFQGDLAFAVLLTDSGTSAAAVEAATRFLDALR